MSFELYAFIVFIMFAIAVIVQLYLNKDKPIRPYYRDKDDDRRFNINKPLW
jgi:hypothetical protein